DRTACSVSSVRRRERGMVRPKWLIGVVAAGGLILGGMLTSAGSPLTAQQPAPSPSATPAPPVVGALGVPSDLPWQIVDPAFTALPGAQAYWGVLDRAAFRIEVPGNWNGELVMYAHGYVGEQPYLRVQ